MDQETIESLEKAIRGGYGNIAGIVAMKGGETVYEGYFNGYAADTAIHVYSVTKSVFSALIGIAIDKGYIRSVDQKVLEFFPDYEVKAGEKTIRDITIRHLLTMTAPYKYETEPYEKFFASANPIQDALDLLGGDKPVGEFNYSAIGGTHILSGILAKATGLPILDFATEYLFSPLGIRVPRNLALRDEEEHFAVMNDRNTRGWAVDAQGLNTASWGLFLTPAEMAKIGRLYTHGGTWEGQRIVSSAWIAESTREHSRCAPWGNLAYGYLWWILDDDSYAALGDGGNAIYVNTKRNMVISIGSILTPDAKDVIELIKKHIEPVFIQG